MDAGRDMGRTPTCAQKYDGSVTATRGLSQTGIGSQGHLPSRNLATMDDRPVLVALAPRPAASRHSSGDKDAPDPWGFTMP